jgi:acetyltransferase
MRTDRDRITPETWSAATTADHGVAVERAREFDREIELEDGDRLRIRPIVPGDESGIGTLVAALSRRTAYQRFFTVMRKLPAGWARDFAQVDYRRRMALVAEPVSGRSPPLVGVSRYEPTDDEGTAEVAIVIHDHWQRRGLGAILLDGILRAGEANGIRRFRARLLTGNRGALAMLSRLTSVEHTETEAGITTVRLVRRAHQPAGAA